MDGDFPWIYVAMIFIAFISWLRGRIADAAEVRRQRIARRKAQARARNTTEPEAYESPYRTEQVGEAEVAELPRTFREVFKELERQITEEEPPPIPEVRVSTPPPLPTTVEAQAMTEPEESPPEFQVAQPSRKRRRKASSAEPTDTLVRVLGNKSQLRTALILKEVLDKPRALQPR